MSVLFGIPENNPGRGGGEIEKNPVLKGLKTESGLFSN
jgi:hypothetical protein